MALYYKNFELRISFSYSPSPIVSSKRSPHFPRLPAHHFSPHNNHNLDFRQPLYLAPPYDVTCGRNDVAQLASRGC
jgi:hypothetical protein